MLSLETEPHPSDIKRSQLAVVGVALVVGSVLIVATLRVSRGGAAFYTAGVALAAVWILASIRFGRIRWFGQRVSVRDQVLLGLVSGALTFAVFFGGAEIGRRISLLARPIDSVLGKADAGPVLAVLALALLNGFAEELFFRGALVDVLPARHALVLSTMLYIAVTAMAGNAALALAALVMGAVFAVQRRITGGLLAPIVTHLVWSTLIIFFLPR